jgi:hypothetical protein
MKNPISRVHEKLIGRGREIAWSLAALTMSQRESGLKVFWPSARHRPRAKPWLDPIKAGLARHASLENVDQNAGRNRHLVYVRVDVEGVMRRIAVDISDHQTVDPTDAAEVDLYFKMQYHRNGYGIPNVMPGGYVPRSMEVYRYLRYLRAIRHRRSFDHDVSGRFGPDFAIDQREKAINLLRTQTKFRYTGGLSKLRYSEYLQEIARSKVCIDLPGNGPFCFRLIEYMAVGACIIAYPHEAGLTAPLVDGTHIVYMREDMSDLRDLCMYYLENEAERERLRRNSQLYFDRHLHYEALAGYYLSTCASLPLPDGRSSGTVGIISSAVA